jgi:hypothetical protein
VFSKAVIGALEVNLKTVTANPSGAAAGSLEGYVALAMLLGPLSKSGKFGRSQLPSLTGWV